MRTIEILGITEECPSCPDLLGIAWHIAQDGFIASYNKKWEIQECRGERTTYREISMLCIHGHNHGNRIYQQSGENWLLVEEDINGKICPLCVEKPIVGCPRCARDRLLHAYTGNGDPFCPGCGMRI